MNAPVQQSSVLPKPSGPSVPTRRPLTWQDVHAMVDAGRFADARCELLWGELVNMSPKSNVRTVGDSDTVSPRFSPEQSVKVADLLP